MAAPKAISSVPLDFGQVQIRWYYNIYGGDCVTTNDLSLAVVLQFGNFKMLFAGDLEAKGWCGMLLNDQFRQELAGINVFVASHHGRESGCHDKLFELLNPAIVVISDDEKQHGTQETDAWYRERCKGIDLINDPQTRRYVLTTRSDGSMRINVNIDGSWQIHLGVAVNDWPQTLPKQGNGLLNGFNYLAS